MQQLDDVVKVIKNLNHQGIKASAANILKFGMIAYSERQMYRVLRYLRDQGKIVRLGHKRGYAAA